MAESILESQAESGQMARSNVFIEMHTERRSCKSFFLEEEEKAFDNFIEQSRFIFKKTGEVFVNRYETLSTELAVSRGGELQRILARTNKQFQAYCLLKKKVDYKKEVIFNFSSMVYEKNLMRTVLQAWRDQKCRILRRKRLSEKAESYNQRRVMRVVLKAWSSIMMQENRAKIKNNVLRKTEVELTRIQKEYEKIIDELERNLSGKLLELKREEEEHKLLHDKYEAMSSRRKVQGEPR